MWDTIAFDRCAYCPIGSCMITKNIVALDATVTKYLSYAVSQMRCQCAILCLPATIWADLQMLHNVCDATLPVNFHLMVIALLQCDLLQDQAPAEKTRVFRKLFEEFECSLAEKKSKAETALTNVSEMKDQLGDLYPAVKQLAQRELENSTT